MMYGDDRPTVAKLSRTVLDLKFMKKTKEKAELQQENEEREKLYQDQLSSLHKGADRIVMVESYFDCMEFLPCRLSFGGMDPDIEKLNEEKLTGVYKVVKQVPKKKPVDRKYEGMNQDITAEEMVQYGSFLGNKAKELLKRKSDSSELENREEQGTKYFKGNASRGQRSLFKLSSRGRGSFFNRVESVFNRNDKADNAGGGNEDLNDGELE